MEFEFAKDALLTLFVALDPPGLIPIFVTLTASMSVAERNKTARTSVLIALCILMAAAIGGAALLKAVGIGIPAFRIAGGLMLFYIAWEMIFNMREERKSGHAEESISKDAIKNVAVFPLAMPMISGPGAITATILLASKTGGNPVNYAILLLSIVIIVFTCWVMFRLAGRIDRMLGYTGRTILERLLGVLLAALAIQIIGDGIVAFAAAS